MKNQYTLDYFYKDTFQSFPEKMKEAGYFEDKYNINEINYNIDLLTTPINKIVDNIKKSKSDKPLLVLLNTGSYSPIHNGHIFMMEKAKKVLNKKYNVVGGYFSPSHDEYVSKKYNGEANINFERRINFCEQALINSEWLMIDTWEARYNKYAINFTDVIQRLSLYLKKHTGKNIAIGYVFGSDNAYFSLAFIKNGISICIERPNYSNEFKDVQKIVKSDRHFFISNNKPPISSSDIRKGNLDNLPLEIKNDFISYKQNIPKNSQYLIRNDIDYATSSIVDSNIDIAKKIFKNKLNNLFKHTFNDFQMNIINLDADKQQEYLISNFHNKEIINIDLWTHTNNQNNLGVSRLFDISDSQIYSNTLINRPNTDILKNQINKIKPGEYILVDDDIASGRTVKMIIDMLPEEIKIKELVALSKISFDKYFNFSIPYEFYDIVDLRDFLFGSLNGGLVVKLPNNNIARVPYILPYVSLSHRAKIPFNKQIEFTNNILNLNLEFFNNLNQSIKIKDMDKSFINLCNYLEFDINMTMIEFCNWHINKIKF